MGADERAGHSGGRRAAATFVLVHGAGDVGWSWHRVEAELRRRGHEVVVMDLPVEDDTAGYADHADAVVEAIGEHRENLVLVGHSFGGYIAPLVCARVPVRLLVLVAAMVPRPGETAGEMFEATGYKPGPESGGDERSVFYHDVPEALAREAMARSRPQSDSTEAEPWPLDAWPELPTRFLACGRDRMFEPSWLSRVVRDRLGIEPDVIDSGHTPALSRPVELADILEAYWSDARDATG